MTVTEWVQGVPTGRVHGTATPSETPQARPASAAANPGAAVRYALLVSEYPAVSHAFIEREVDAVRARGAEVTTFTVRPSRAAGSSRTELANEIRATTSLLGRAPSAYLLVHARLLARHPRAWTAALRAAAARGPRDPRAVLWQLFYFVEAGVLLAEMRRRSLRHVHVHFANGGADVARTAVDLAGRIRPAERWTWSLAMHGPTELENVASFDLPAKVRSASFVASISDFCRSQLVRHVEGEHWDKVHVVRMGVDSATFPGRAQERAARPAGPLRILFVGRLVPEKGPHVLVDAVASLVAEGVAVEVVVAGDGVLREALAAQVARRGLGGTVTLVGAVAQQELPELYGWADVFCLPSLAEGIPVVLMEAMSTELPVISTRVAGIPELIADGECGRLVAPGRVDQLVGALREVATGDRAVTRAWGERGRDVVRTRFDPAVNAAELEGLIRRAGA